MKIFNAILFLLFLGINGIPCLAQNPYYICYDVEQGLPSNEVYSITKDSNGFIWIGCASGLYKFDGVRYIKYSNQFQNSKAISGLTFSKSGKLYCFNFQSQLFFIENDSLKILENHFGKINNIICDQEGNIYVSHLLGVSKYNEQTKKWKHYSFDQFDKNISSVIISKDKNIFCLSSKGIAQINSNSIELVYPKVFYPVGNFIMENLKDVRFIFSTYQNIFLKEQGGQYFNLKGTKLYSELYNRKITNIVAQSDSLLWICTYKGLVKYNVQLDEVTIFYPEMAFSDLLIDDNGDYWFTSLQNGIIRVSNFQNLVWNKNNSFLRSDKITQITCDSQYVYFTTAHGSIGKLNTLDYKLELFNNVQKADVQSLDYDFENDKLYFNINTLYYLSKHKVGKIDLDIKSIKSIHKIGQDFIILNSFGVHVRGTKKYKISNIWSRQLIYDSLKKNFWIASNKGILKGTQLNNNWRIVDSIETQKQFLSIVSGNHSIYALSFDGFIYEIADHSVSVIAQLTENIQCNKLNIYKNKLFVSSNNGIWVFDLINKYWEHLNTISGIASNDVKGLVLLKDNIWIAGGKGLQKIPINSIAQKVSSKIFLKKPIITENLKYGTTLFIYPEVNDYRSNGKFIYAYTINNSKWIKLPASIEQIEVQNLPIGNFEIRLKAMSYLGNDTENEIILKGSVQPPLYLTWWFLLLIAVIVFFVIYIIHKKIVSNIRIRETTKTAIAESQLTALKAQMNPHFIFNVLNSIKFYIYENDRDKAINYLDDFSELIRRILESSKIQYISLEEELKILNLYIELEEMMFEQDFNYEIYLDSSLDRQIKIPSMLLQPFVENAFKHGLRHQQGLKKLYLEIKCIDKNEISISILDNGIGRAASAMMNKTISNKNNSFALNAIDKRIKLINTQKKVFITYSIIDINEQKRTGTIIKINLRYFNS